mgnify:CR=1 FL=1
MRRKRKSRIKKRKTRVKKRRSRIKKRKAHFKRRRTRVKKRKFINKKTRRKKRRTIQKGGLGFKDLFMALSLLTASLSEATSMLPRTRAVIDNINDETVVCSTGVSHAERSLSPTGVFRGVAPGLHTDRLRSLTDEDKSTAAFHMGALKDIAGELKKKQKTIPDGTCKKLINMIGPDQMQTLTDIKEFIIKHHDEDENTQKKESNGDGNKSDDSETTDSNLPLIGLATTTLGGLQLWGKYNKNEEEKEKEEEENDDDGDENQPLNMPPPGHITGIGSYYH